MGKGDWNGVGGVNLPSLLPTPIYKIWSIVEIESIVSTYTSCTTRTIMLAVGLTVCYHWPYSRKFKANQRN